MLKPASRFFISIYARTIASKHASKHPEKFPFRDFFYALRHIKKKHKALISKYKPYILKYVPCIFKQKPCIFSHLHTSETQ